MAVFWGMISAVFASIYSIQPKPLIDRWGVVPVASWGMMAAGIAGLFLANPIVTAEGLDAKAWLALSYIVLAGTVAAFWLYLALSLIHICLDPVSGELPASFEAQCRQAFRNVFAIVKAAGGTPADIVRQTVYLTDLNNFAVVNKVMSEIFSAPYPARSCVQISALPKGGLIEVEATVVLD